MSWPTTTILPGSAHIWTVKLASTGDCFLLRLLRKDQASKQTNKQTNKQTHDEHSTRLIWLANNSGLNSIRYPSWDKVGVGQITSFLSFFIHFLHLRLNFVQEVAVIIVDKIESFHVLKVVAVVK